MTPDSASDLVAKLGEEASPRPWVAGYQGQGNDIWAKQPDEHWHDADLVFVEARPRGSHRPANAAYTALAVNSIMPLLKALEEAQQTMAFTIHAGGAALALADSSAVTRKAQAGELLARQALATVRDAAQKALP